MDIVFGLFICLVCWMWLQMQKHHRKPKKKQRQHIGVLLFGNWFYWLLTIPGAIRK